MYSNNKLFIVYQKLYFLGVDKFSRSFKTFVTNFLSVQTQISHFRSQLALKDQFEDQEDYY